MPSNKTDKQGMEVFDKNTSNPFIAKVKDFTAKIIKINNYARQKYQIQPLLLLMPFAAGIIIAGLFGNFNNNNNTPANDHLNVVTAGISGSGHSTSPNSGNSNPKPELLIAQADNADISDEDQSASDNSEEVPNISLPDDMKSSMSPDEIKIFELFSEMAELQAEKGQDSPEVNALKEQLDTLIDKVQEEKEADNANKKTETDNNRKTSEPAEKTVIEQKPKTTTKTALGILPKINGKVNPPRTVLDKKNDDNNNNQKDPNNRTAETVTPRTTTKQVPTKTTTAKSVKTKTIADKQAETKTAEDLDSQDIIEKEPEIKLPSDSIRIQTKDDRIDLSELLLTVGKELELNFWYEDSQVPTSSVLLQQYGTIKREELLPLLTSVLAKCNPPYMMVKDGPYTKIMKMTDIQKNTGIFSPDLDDQYEDNLKDTIVATVVALENIDYNTTLKPILDKFIPTSDIITEIPNTNKIVIADYSSNLKRINDIIGMVDVSGPEKKLEILVPTYLKPEDTKKILEDMYNKLYGEDGVLEKADNSSPAPQQRDQSRLASMSPAERAKAIAAERNQQLAARNQARSGRSQQPASSSSIAPSITVDKRTGRLFIIGTEAELVNIMHIMSLFDVPKGGQQVELKIYSPVYLDSQNAVEKIQKLMKAIDEEQAEQEQADSPDTQPDQPTPTRTNRQTTPQRRTTTQAANQEQVDGMFMLVDDRTNRIITLGWKEQIEQFEELLALFDVPLPGGEISLQILKLENTESADTLSKVKELLNAINEQSTGKAPSDNTVTGRPSTNRQRTQQNRNNNNPQTSSSTLEEGDAGPFMLADERLNRILIVGVQDQIDQAKELVEIIDQEWPNSEVRLEIFTFDVVEVEAITEQITELIEAMSVNQEDTSSGSSIDRSRSSDIFGTGSRQQNRTGAAANENRSNAPSLQQIGEEGPFLMADSRLNRLFVVGMDDQIKQVDDMINILDKSIGLDLNIAPQLKYIISSDAADQIAKLLAVLHEQEEPQTGSSSSRSNQYGNSNRYGDNRNSLNQLNERNDRNRSAVNRNTNSGYNRRDGISSIIEVSPRGPFLLPDDRTNRLLIVSTDEQYNEIVDLLPVIDVPPSKHDNMTLEIHQLKFVQVDEVISILDTLELTQTSENLDEKYRRYGPGSSSLTRQQSFDPISGQNVVINDWNSWTNIEEPLIYVASHTKTNRLFIYATLYQHEEIAEMIKVIDVEPDDTMGQVKVFKMRNQEPATIAGALETLYVQPLIEQGEVSEGESKLQGLEMAPTVHELEDIFSVAVRGSKRQLEDIEKIINDIDIPMPQVLIEASLVKISLDDSFKLGVSLKDAFNMPDGSSVSGSSPFSIDGISLGSNGVAVGTGGTIAYFKEDFVYAALEAINTNTNSEISSMPRVLTLDNKEAEINSSVSKPITRTTIPAGSDTPITEVAEWKEAGTTLTVTPHIGVFDDDPNNLKSFLRLEINLDVDNFTGEGNDTTTQNNSITSHVNIPNGAYIILGGLTQTSWSEVEKKIPLLGDIPLLGAAFRSISKSKGRTVLYVFVKAEIVSDQDFDQLKALSKINKEKMLELQENFNEMPIIPGFKPEKRERIHQ